MHVLIVRFSSLGDVVLTTSLLGALKKRWGEEIRITYLTSDGFSSLLENHPYIDRLVTVKREGGFKGLKLVEKAFKQLKQSHPVDFLLDLHGTLRSLYLRARFPFIPRLSTDKRSLERWLLCSFKINTISKSGEDRNKRPGETILKRVVRDFSGIFQLNELTSYPHSSLAQSFQESAPDSLLQKEFWPKLDKYLLLVPSASFVEKRWPLDRFKLLGQKLCQWGKEKGYQVVVTAGPTDDFCREFDSLEEEYPDQFFNLQGKTNLTESAWLAKNALFYIGNDTGIPLMAEAQGTNGFVLLGPTGEEFGYYPHLPKSEAIYKRLWCRPCTTNGKGRCIRKERYCLTLITVDEVFNKTKRWLENNHESNR